MKGVEMYGAVAVLAVAITLALIYGPTSYVLTALVGAVAGFLACIAIVAVHINPFKNL